MATIGAVAGWVLGDYVARYFGYKKGIKYWAISGRHRCRWSSYRLVRKNSIIKGSDKFHIYTSKYNEKNASICFVVTWYK